MIGRLYNKMRQERVREEERERRRPATEHFLAERKSRDEFYALLDSDAPWRNTRRIKCACGNTARYDIPQFPVTFRCTQCGGRQTVVG